MRPTIQRLTALALLALPLLACGAESDTHDEGSEFAGAWEERNLDKADSIGRGCSGVVVPDQGPFRNRVHLTFDDGPNPETTPQIMATLRRYNAPATFFINGKRVHDAATRAIVEEIASDPLFTLANHSQSHKNMARLSLEDVATQVDQTTAIIEAAGGTTGYFRFPFGSSTCDTMELVEGRGLTSTGWHIDSADWCFAADQGVCSESTFEYVPDRFREDMSGLVMNQLGRREGGIVLFHDIHPSTEAALEGILQAMLAADYELVALDETTFPRLHGVEQAFIGDTCSTDNDCTFPGGFCMPEADGGTCSLECETACPDRAGYPTTRCIVPPVGVSEDFRVCALGCSADSCREGLRCQERPDAAGEMRQVCF